MRRLAAGMVLAAALAACAAPPPPQAQQSPPERRWAPKIGVRLCPALEQAKRPYTGCATARGGYTVLTRRYLSVPGGGLAHKISTEDGKTGYISDIDYALSKTELARDMEIADAKEARAAAAACDRRGGIAIGMTRAQVHASCWGKPRSVNLTVVGSGRRHEQLVYGGGNYVYLTGGIVTAIQTGN